jgi:hypothetical protein
LLFFPFCSSLVESLDDQEAREDRITAFDEELERYAKDYTIDVWVYDDHSKVAANFEVSI